MPNQQTQTTAADGDRLKPIEYIGYALGDTASGFFLQTFNIFLTYYYVDVWGIPATALLWLLPVVRAFGAFDDVIMGLIADRTNTRWGKFRPYLLFGAIPALIYAIMHWEKVGKMMMVQMAFSFIAICGLVAGSINYGWKEERRNQKARELGLPQRVPPGASLRGVPRRDAEFLGIPIVASQV